MGCCGFIFKTVLMVLAIAWLVDGLNNRGMPMGEWLKTVYLEGTDWLFRSSWSAFAHQVTNLVFG